MRRWSCPSQPPKFNSEQHLDIVASIAQDADITINEADTGSTHSGVHESRVVDPAQHRAQTAIDTSRVSGSGEGEGGDKELGTCTIERVKQGVGPSWQSESTSKSPEPQFLQLSGIDGSVRDGDGYFLSISIVNHSQCCIRLLGFLSAHTCLVFLFQYSSCMSANESVTDYMRLRASTFMHGRVDCMGVCVM